MESYIPGVEIARPGVESARPASVTAVDIFVTEEPVCITAGCGEAVRVGTGPKLKVKETAKVVPGRGAEGGCS